MVFNLLNRLQQYHNLELIAFSMNDGILAQKLKETGIETHVISEKENNFLQIYKKVRGILRGRKVYFIHSHRYKENLLAVLLRPFFPSARLLTTIHGLPESFSGIKKLKSNSISKLNSFAVRNFFTSIVAVSYEINDSLIRNCRFPPEKVTVIHNGINVPVRTEASSHIQHNGFHIGTAGRMVPVKDYHLFLDIAAAVTKEAPHVRFSILGDGPLKDELKKRATELQLDRHVNLLSTQPDPFPYYHSLDLYLNTSFHEGIPISILEAMACGKPVIAPRVGGIPEIISHAQNGFLVDGRKPEDFAAICLSFVKNHTLKNRMGQAAREKITKDFNASKMAQFYYKLYVSTNLSPFAMGDSL